ncbi:hypothetical protein BHE74_00031495 [Ensete ventricosum]|nr:hypothetical protein BHE74_00031495 [Ensete ventricosum]RZS21122.1 hypothetical protein BHM03_00053711 [Ensete ventricosum]
MDSLKLTAGFPTGASWSRAPRSVLELIGRSPHVTRSEDLDSYGEAQTGPTSDSLTRRHVAVLADALTPSTWRSPPRIGSSCEVGVLCGSIAWVLWRDFVNVFPGNTTENRKEKRDNSTTVVWLVEHVSVFGEELYKYGAIREPHLFSSLRSPHRLFRVRCDPLGTFSEIDPCISCLDSLLEFRFRPWRARSIRAAALRDRSRLTLFAGK